MICVSIAEKTAESCLQALKRVDFAEIRIDKMAVGIEDVKRIFSRHPKLIATFRPGLADDKKRKELLSAAIEAGAAFVDVEVEASDRYKKTIVGMARTAGCKVIISYHNFERTPKKAELEHIIEWCFESGADIAKIACKVNSEKDNARLLGLLCEPRPLVVTGMGNMGKISRIVSPFLGSPFTYASLQAGKETAEGQIDKDSLERIFLVLNNV